MMLTLPLVFAAGFSLMAGAQTDSVLAGVFLFPAAYVGTLIVTILVWPFRFARSQSANVRVLPDGTVLTSYYDLRYLEANRTVLVRAVNGVLDVGNPHAGVFSTEHLASLHVDEAVNDGYPGMADLAFSGDIVEHQTLFGWPGVPVRIALEIRDALLARSGACPAARAVVVGG